MFVIDGVPVNNGLSGNISEIGASNTVDYGYAISDLEETSYSTGQKDNPWSKPWLYQAGVDEP